MYTWICLNCRWKNCWEKTRSPKYKYIRWTNEVEAISDCTLPCEWDGMRRNYHKNQLNWTSIFGIFPLWEITECRLCQPSIRTNWLCSITISSLFALTLNAWFLLAFRHSLFLSLWPATNLIKLFISISVNLFQQ